MPSKFKIILTQNGLQNFKPKAYFLGEQPPVRSSDIQNPNSTDLPVGSSDVQLVNIANEGDTPNGVSLLGTPVFSNLILYLPSNADIALRIDTVLITVSMTKNIVKTAIQGRNGTFKEYVSDGDYSISIRGILTTNNANQYPKADMQVLYDLLTASEPLEAVSDYLAVFGVQNLVVESFNIPQVEAFYNTQPFEITCSSDEPLELFL
jgi:hypothetical protein